eukprot:jgi/Ulvmu1/5063/UM021_0080.1
MRVACCRHQGWGRKQMAKQADERRSRVQEEEGKRVELYGPWQTRAWAPPAAQNGIVPRNDHGNVEVPPFAAAVPEGTVYIDLPRAAAAAAALEVDAAPALVGFEQGRQGGMLPKIRGVVVCIEHADAVRDAAQAAEEARLEKLRQKRLARGRDVWVQVLLTVHERLQLQRVVDAEQRPREVRLDECGPPAATPDSEAAHACSGQDHGDEEAARKSAHRRTRGKARQKCGKGKREACTDAENEGAAADCEGPTKRGRSMSSRLRLRLNALTGE